MQVQEQVRELREQELPLAQELEQAQEQALLAQVRVQVLALQVQVQVLAGSLAQVKVEVQELAQAVGLELAQVEPLEQELE